MGDQEAVDRPGERRPGAHPRGGAWAQQVDRRVAAEVVPPPVRRQRALVRAPAQLGRLAAFAHEAVDRPGVDELVRRLRPVRDLRVALGDMDRLDAEPLGEQRPVPARRRQRRRRAGVVRDPQQRRLHEMRNEARIGAVRQDCGGPRPGAQGQRAFAQRIVGALRRVEREVGVAARPGLGAGVEVERTKLAGERDERDRGHVHRQVQQEVPRSEQRPQRRLVIPALQRRDDAPDARLRRDGGPPLVRGQNGDPLRRDVDVAEEERQDPLTDAAAADHDQSAAEGDVLHRILFLLSCRTMAAPL